MKKIIAYVNTMRVHPLVEELGKSGIRQLVVTEYFTLAGPRMHRLEEEEIV